MPRDRNDAGPRTFRCAGIVTSGRGVAHCGSTVVSVGITGSPRMSDCAVIGSSLSDCAW